MAVIVATVATVAMAVTGQRYNERARQIIAGDYLVRWTYAQGEWRQFVDQERTRAIRTSCLFLPLLALAALLALVGAATGDSFITGGITGLLVLDAGFLGILRPDGYRPLQCIGYRLAAVDVLRGTPSMLRFRVRLACGLGLLASLGNAPGHFEIRVPVPYGHEAEVAGVLAQLASAGLLRGR